jgi:hypothetical protein
MDDLGPNTSCRHHIMRSPPLRFVERFQDRGVLGPSYVRILQTLVTCAQCGGSEWVDVPLVKEDGDG